MMVVGVMVVVEVVFWVKGGNGGDETGIQNGRKRVEKCWDESRRQKRSESESGRTTHRESVGIQTEHFPCRTLMTSSAQAEHGG